MPKHLKTVTLGDLRQFARGFGDEGGGFFRTATVMEVRARRRAPGSPALPTVPSFAQIRPESRLRPGLWRNCWVVKYNFRDAYSYGLGRPSISGDLTGTAPPPMFGSHRPAASLAEPA